MLLGSFHEKSHSISLFITNCAHYVFGGILCVFIYADDATVLVAPENGGLDPADKIGNPFLQQFPFNELFAFRIRYFTQFNFIVYLYGSE